MRPTFCLALLVCTGCVAGPSSEPVPPFEGNPQPAEPYRIEPVSFQDGGSNPANAAADAKSNRVTFYVGQRMLEEDDWAPLEDQPMLGLEFAQEKPGSAVGWEFGLMGSRDDDEVLNLDVEASTLEIYGGLRKTFGKPGAGIKPYVGGGLSVVRGRIEVGGGGSESDTVPAAYLHGGVLAQLKSGFFVGADLRALLGAEFETGSIPEVDGDYTQIGVLLGWAF